MKVNFFQRTKALYHRVIKPSVETRKCQSIPFPVNRKYFNDNNPKVLSRVGFDEPITIIDAFCNFIKDSVLIEYLEIFKTYSAKKDMQKIINDLMKSNKIKDKKTNGLIGYGVSSYVFDIGENKVLKITHGDHFSGRIPQEFDLPIIKQGRLCHNSDYFFYIEDKVEVDNISAKDIENIKTKAQKLDFIITDIHPRQFGKSLNGKVYLLDPECVKLGTDISFTKPT